MFNPFHKNQSKKDEEREPNKLEFEKNDILALVIAAATVFVPVLIGFFLLIALLIKIFY